MRILLHDFGGYAFIVPLSRGLAGMGHEVLHAYCGSVQTPQGLLQRRDDDAPGLRFQALRLGEQIRKQALVKRWKQERQYAAMLSDLVRQTAPDVVISADTPSQIQARLVKQCRRAGIAFVSWVQDLYGLAAYQILSRKLPFIGAALGRHYMRLDRRCLRDSDAVVLITEAFREMTTLWGIADGLTTVIPNWAAIEELPPCPKDNDWARERGLDDKFCFVYSGTLAMKHNPELLLKLGLRFRGRPYVRVVVVSEGPGADWLREAASRHGLENVLVLPFEPFERLPSVLGAADVLVSILEPEAGGFSVPSKVLTYLCASRPLLLGVPPSNLAAQTVVAASAGLVAAPTDPGAFVSAAERLLADPALRRQLGRNGRRYAEGNFQIGRITERFSTILGSVKKAA